MMALPLSFSYYIKKIALVLGLAVDVIMSVVCFSTQAFDPISKVAFISLGIMIVLLIAIAYKEKSILLWLACVIVIFYFDLSFLLVNTSPDNVPLTEASDTELKRIDLEIERAKQNEQASRSNYRTGLVDPTITKDTMAALKAMVDSDSIVLQSLSQERYARRTALSNGEILSVAITAEAIFQAVSRSVEQSRYAAILIYALICGIIQAMIVFSLKEPKNANKLYPLPAQVEPAFIAQARPVVEDPIHTPVSTVASVSTAVASSFAEEPSPLAPSPGPTAIPHSLEFLQKAWPPRSKLVYSVAEIVAQTGWPLEKVDYYWHYFFDAFEKLPVKKGFITQADRDRFIRSVK